MFRGGRKLRGAGSPFTLWDSVSKRVLVLVVVVVVVVCPVSLIEGLRQECFSETPQLRLGDVSL